MTIDDKLGKFIAAALLVDDCEKQFIKHRVDATLDDLIEHQQKF